GEDVNEVDARRALPARARLVVEAAQLGVGRGLARAGQLLGQKERLLHDALADDRIVALEAELQSLAVEDLVLEGALVDVRRDRRARAPLSAGLEVRHRRELLAREDDPLVGGPRAPGEKEDRAAQESELNETNAHEACAPRERRRHAGIVCTARTGTPTPN